MTMTERPRIRGEREISQRGVHKIFKFKSIAHVNMDNVPEALRNLPDGSRFLQLQERLMHIYLSQDVVKRAVENGLMALRADGNGIHLLNPRSKRGTGVRMEEGQVYTTHGVCRGGFEAAIQAARRVFPSCSIEGCSWHLSQAWVRKRNTLGILHFLKGDARSKRVRRWWRTLKGLPFLPQDCLRFVTALTAPPVPAHHPAHTPCSKFLEYLRSTWLEGPFQNMWCKYLVHELRTTNTAENYHSRLRKIIGKNHPPLAQLILAFRSLTSIAKVTLMRMEVLRHESRSLRTRDQIRREK
ncbi:hypothetical protein OESDEN_22758, partial [Oesophagostomum dentatum]